MSEMDPEILAERKKMQMEIMLKDSDMKKNERNKLAVEVLIRELKYKLTQIQSEILSKEAEMKKIQGDQMQFGNELIKLKHQMNNLGR